VQIKNQMITALDWVISKENDIIAVGDSVLIEEYQEWLSLCAEVGH
jgi:hypothetical protein